VYYLQRKKSLLMFLRADTLDIATAWVNTINRAIQVAQTIHFSPKWPIEVIQKFTSAASGYGTLYGLDKSIFRTLTSIVYPSNFDEGVMGDDPVLADIADAPVRRLFARRGSSIQYFEYSLSLSLSLSTAGSSRSRREHDRSGSQPIVGARTGH
jgi:hypothetical protein